MKTHKFLVTVSTNEVLDAGWVQGAVYSQLCGENDHNPGRPLALGEWCHVGRVGDKVEGERYAGTPVLQDWVSELPLMQQTVLLTAIRGPDGVRKDHVAKLVLRWLRRCILISAFDKCVLTNPYDTRGGSFTGPSLHHLGDDLFAARDMKIESHTSWPKAMNDIFSAYIKATDELPHHFQAHVRNSVEILGYKHPDQQTRQSWFGFYLRLCDDLHLNPETTVQLGYRLGDSKDQWEKAGDRSSCGRDERVGAGYDPESDNPNVAASRRKP